MLGYRHMTPVMFSDPSGKFPFLITLAIIGLVVGAGVGAGVGLSQGHTGWQLVGDIALGGLIGGVAGLLIGAGISGALTGGFFSSWTGVKAGAQLVYGMYKVGGAAAAGYMMLDNLGHSFSQFTHVFYSGGYVDNQGNIVDVSKNRAAELANATGGKTIDMTRIGTYLTKMGYSSDHSAWTYASANFANQVPYLGKVHAILYYPGMSEASVWLTTELPSLVKRFIEIIIGGL